MNNMSKTNKEWNEYEKMYSGNSGHNPENTEMLNDWNEERKEMIDCIKKLLNSLKGSEETIDEITNIPSVNRRLRTENLINEIQNKYFEKFYE